MIRRPNIGFVGRMQSGKSTASRCLVVNYDYTRLSFADPVRELAELTNPIVEPRGTLTYLQAGTLYGYEGAKRNYPEFRRVLQDIGAGARRVLGENVWVDAWIRRYADSESPVVVDDVRYANEVARLRDLGFLLVRINRPGEPVTDHESERGAALFDVDVEIQNNRDIAHLRVALDELVNAYSRPCRSFTDLPNILRSAANA